MTAQTHPAAIQASTTPLISSQRFDWTVALIGMWLILGVHLDAWAHHQFADTLESFFTPWHGVLYSALFAAMIVIGATLVINLRRGYPLRQALPVGYNLTLLGILIFMANGFGDMIWHTLFGIEDDVEALLSPTHLMLAAGGALIIAGPIQAIWKRTKLVAIDKPPAPWVVVIGLTSLLALLAFFTAYAHPYEFFEKYIGQAPQAETQLEIYQGLGIASLIIQTLLVLGVITLALQRWTLRPGSLTFIVGFGLVLVVSVHEDFQLIPTAILTGLAIDGLYLWLKPSMSRPGALQQFAVAAPMAYAALHLGTLALLEGIWWTIHLWAGAIVIAGVIGWMPVYLLTLVLQHPRPNSAE